ncbi:hypothetical protein AB0G87_37430 [Streptomyces asoensis]|uniref:hypothetical protein n=1 Tax=Streptomyces asoensis TaxID=249586 RepID=UPI0033CFA27B
MDARPVRIQGDPEVIKEIEALVRESDDAHYLRTEQDDSGGIGADFDLATVATIVGMASSLFFDGPTRISVETPAGSVSITASGDFSEDSLRRALRELTRQP